MYVFVPREILDIIFRFVPSAGIHVSKKYNNVNVLKGRFMSAHNWLVFQHRKKPDMSRNAMIMSLYGDHNSIFPEEIRDLNVIDIDTVIRSIHTGQCKASHICMIVHPNVIDTIFSDAALVTKLIYNGTLTNDLASLIDIDLLRDTYVKVVIRRLSAPCVRMESLEQIMKKLSSYNYLLEDLLYSHRYLPYNIKTTIIKSLPIVKETINDPKNRIETILAILLK